MKPHVSPIRRCKGGFRVDDYMGQTYEFATIDGALSKAREIMKPKRPQYIRENGFYVWQVMAPMITSRPQQKISQGRAVSKF